VTGLQRVQGELADDVCLSVYVTLKNSNNSYLPVDF